MQSASAQHSATQAAPRPAALLAVDRAAFVAAISGMVTSVNVLTTDGRAGRFGATVSAVTSVSADPPMVLVCLNRRSPATEAVRANGVFCLNLLAAHHSELSDVFAGRPCAGRAFDFGCAEWHPGPTGAAQLAGAAAVFDCTVESAHQAGSHTVFIGRVVGVAAADHVPLAYCKRTYVSLAALQTA